MGIDEGRRGREVSGGEEGAHVRGVVRDRREMTSMGTCPAD